MNLKHIIFPTVQCTLYAKLKLRYVKASNDVVT